MPRKASLKAKPSFCKHLTGLNHPICRKKVDLWVEGDKNNFMVALKFFFYKFYQFAKYFGGSDVESEANATFNTVLLVYFNIITIKYIIEKSINKIIFDKPVEGCLFGLTALLIYFQSIYRKRYTLYFPQFEKQNPTQKKLGTMAIFIYLGLSIFLFFHYYPY